MDNIHRTSPNRCLRTLYKSIRSCNISLTCDWASFSLADSLAAFAISSSTDLSTISADFSAVESTFSSEFFSPSFTAAAPAIVAAATKPCLVRDGKIGEISASGILAWKLAVESSSKRVRDPSYT